MTRTLCLLLGVFGLACATPGTEEGRAAEDLGASRSPSKGRFAYHPDRRDYFAFRAAHPNILEPNYLPFMLHRFGYPGPEGDLLLLCRWDDERMPLGVYVEMPEIPDALQDEFHPTHSEEYTSAVRAALRTWESEIDGLVRFELVEAEVDADLRVRLAGERAPAPRPNVVILGSTEALLGACQPESWDPNSNQLSVEFDVPELLIYIADEHGLLTPGQVERVTLHELGHALGMLGHSPDPRDLMFAAYREWSDVETLSQADVRSFVSLYRLPNGVHYGNARRGTPSLPPPPLPPTSVPALSPAPTVDAVRGFSFRAPRGWLVAESARGAFASNGPTWDYDVSIEIAFWPYDNLDEFLARYGTRLLRGAWFRLREPTVVAGHAATRIVVESPDGDRVRVFRFVELEEGRLLVLITQAPVEAEEEWAAWFAASLATLKLAAEGQAWH